MWRKAVLVGIFSSVPACTLALEGTYEQAEVPDAGSNRRTYGLDAQAPAEAAPYDVSAHTDGQGSPAEAEAAAPFCPPGVPSEVEPNNTPQAASPVDVAICGVTSMNDVDFFRIDPPKSDKAAYAVRIDTPSKALSYEFSSGEGYTPSGTGSGGLAGSTSHLPGLLRISSATASPTPYLVTVGFY